MNVAFLKTPLMLYCPDQIKKQQQRILMVLDSKKVPYKLVDVSSDEEGKALMRKIAGDQKALPPQIANGAIYCGVSLAQ